MNNVCCIRMNDCNIYRYNATLLRNNSNETVANFSEPDSGFGFKQANFLLAKQKAQQQH